MNIAAQNSEISDNPAQRHRLTKVCNRAARRRFALFAIACVVGMTLGIERTLAISTAGPERASSQQMTNSDSLVASSDSDRGNKYKLDIGDKLKVTIHGRDDLSGDYRINDRGLLRIPTMGSFAGAGSTPIKIEQDILRAVEQAQQRKGDVAVEVLERRPVYVTGFVAKPGSFPFSAGITVLHAVALAGGTGNLAQSSLLPTEVMRERSRLQTSSEELIHLLARRARLMVERDGKTEIVAAPEQLINMIGRQRAAALIRRKQVVLDKTLASLARERQNFQSAIEESQNEMNAFKRELEQIRRQVQLRKQRVTKLTGLAKMGLTASARVVDSQVLLARAGQDAQTAIASISRSKRLMKRAERDLAMVTLERNLEIEQELQSIDEQLAKLKKQIAGSKLVIEGITQFPSALLTLQEPHSYKYEVMRTNSDGQARFIPMTETSFLMPGDVLRIKPQQGE